MSFRPVNALLVVMLAFGTVCAQESARPWLDVPFVEQVEEGCGSASISMVMRYWDKQQGRQSDEATDATRIHEALYAPEAGGIYASAMEGYLRKHGFRTFAFRGDWEFLRQHLEKGRPLIVALKPSGTSGLLHYVVVVGADPKQDLLFVNDPAQRKLLKQDRTAFEKQWEATGNWTLLAVPQPEGSE